MALLWVEAMSWHDGAGLSREQAMPVSVRKAGFKGYVGGGYDYDEDSDMMPSEREEKQSRLDEDLYDDVTPEPTKAEQAHYDKHGEHPDSYYERHDQAYAKAVADKAKENEPDLEDERLHTFVAEHGANNALWQSKGHLGPVDLRKGVYATQSHVSRRIMDEHEHDPSGGSWTSREQRQKGRDYQSDYLGEGHPMFVTHEGRLHATEGHHRVAVALQRGDSHITGWHYDADKHGLGKECSDCGYPNDPIHPPKECENCGEKLED